MYKKIIMVLGGGGVMSQMGGIQTGGGVFSRRQSSLCKHVTATTKSFILIQLLK